LDTAYLEAFRAATEMWIEALREVRNPSRQRFEIRDDFGRVVLDLPFYEIIESAKGGRRRAPPYHQLMESFERTRSVREDIVDEISLAWGRLREAKESLAKFDEMAARIK
jgi:hypothetical protein